MSSITDQKQYILQSIFRNKLVEHELNFYTNGSTIISYNGEELLCSSKQKKIFFILQGHVQVKGNDEPVTTLSSGFIGLSFLFQILFGKSIKDIRLADYKFFVWIS
ncbi:MAG: hypothetical protein HC939_21290 [Pleurocapsa sp. SU_5_0]|nr:hypothetical protein [Pleurocapsa sp. SU_5_0]